MLDLNEIENLKISQKNARCGLCSNNCQLNIYNFSSKRYISGNRCDRPLKSKNKSKKFNMYKYKYERLFDYVPLDIKKAKRGVIGIPRVLNIYEHYPFWFTLFTELDFQVVISSRSNKKIYELGMQTIPSESLCYPAKLANGHIQDLINFGIKNIFYPSVIFEDDDSKDNKYSCPVITSYPEVIKSNMDSIKENDVNFMHPFINFSDEKTLFKNLKFLINEFDVSKVELKEAIQKASLELENYNNDLLKKTKEILKEIEENNDRAIVLSGRPYHLDPEINHGIDDMIISQNINVLAEDSISKLEKEKISLRVIDQWTYHSRLYKAANFVAKHKNLELIQLNSFGCGIDSITSDQVKEILEHYNKVYTGIKIDEGENLGAAKIRVRSLDATLKNRINKKEIKENYNYKPTKIEGNLKDYTILAPQMSPFHFELIQEAAKSEGYNVNILPEVDKGAIDYGLKYVHNDSCYPALVVIGQMIKALENYDLKNEKIALIITQTGGGCRATNYIALLRKGLKEAGMENIPVIALNGGNVEDTNTFDLTYNFIKKSLISVLYGDVLLRCVHKIRPYEKEVGSTDKLHKKWVDIIKKDMDNTNYFKFRKNVKKMIKDFDNLDIDSSEKKPKVGVVGEILVKYHPTANNQLVKLLEENGAEVVIPDFLDFFLYGMYGRKYLAKSVKYNKKNALIETSLYKFLELYRGVLKKEFKKSKNFTNIHSITHTANNASKFLDIGNQTGEGWFLTGEIVNLLEDGVDNIVCTQPFGCLPNHIMGKGMFKPLREKYPQANIIAIDYDPGASEVNQVSRIKLMLSVAKKKIKR